MTLPYRKFAGVNSERMEEDMVSLLYISEPNSFSTQCSRAAGYKAVCTWEMQRTSENFKYFIVPTSHRLTHLWPGVSRFGHRECKPNLHVNLKIYQVLSIL